MTRSARKAWTTAQKNRARDRAERLGRMELAVLGVAEDVRGLAAATGLSLADGFREVWGRTWFKVVATVGFAVLLLAGMGWMGPEALLGR